MNAAGTLMEYQRAWTHVCGTLDPSTAVLPTDPLIADRWLLYRRMVRGRLREHLGEGIPRTIAALGEAGFGAWFDRWLDASMPRSRFIRDIVEEFLAFALPRWNANNELPAFLVDLATFEQAQWAVRHVPNYEGLLETFDFHKIPVLHPAVRFVDLAYAVHEAPIAEDPLYRKERVQLCVFRNKDNRGTSHWTINDFASELLTTWSRNERRTVTEAVRSIAATRSTAITTDFIEKLSGFLADMIEQGVILGCR